MNNDTPNAAPLAEKIPQPPSKPVRRFSKRKIIISALVLVVVLALAGLAYYFKGWFIAATVDGHPISRLSVVRELEKQSGSQVLDSLINEKLIQNAAAKQHITVSDDEIQKQIRSIEDQFTQQGSTLDEALANEGLTRDDLNKQVVLQVQAEKLLGDKVNVTDDEVEKYIKDNSLTFDTSKDIGQQKEQVREVVKQQKFDQEIATWFNDARTSAKIHEYAGYKK